MIDICPRCGYSLTGLPAEHACPECGGRYDRMTAIWRQRSNWAAIVPAIVWLVLLVGLLAMKGVEFLNNRGGPLGRGPAIAWLVVGPFVLWRAVRELNVRRAGLFVACLPEGLALRQPEIGRLTYPWSDIESVSESSRFPRRPGALIRTPGGGRLHITGVFRARTDVSAFVECTRAHLSRARQAPHVARSISL